MVGQAIALGAVKGYVLAIDSTAFKTYSARDAKKVKSDPDADVHLKLNVQTVVRKPGVEGLLEPRYVGAGLPPPPRASSRSR